MLFEEVCSNSAVLRCAALSSWEHAGAYPATCCAVLQARKGFNEYWLQAHMCCAVLCCPAGQKGIGFKSVFRVTQCPNIHTNGFHFSFDLRKHANLGYVLPTWLGGQPLEPELQQALDSSALMKITQQSSGVMHAGTAETDTTGQGQFHKMLFEFLQQKQTLETDDQEVLDDDEMRHQEQLQVWLANLHTTTPAASGGFASQIAAAAAGAVERHPGLGPGTNLTAIHLPLRPECDEVSQKLDQLRPTLLLFLRKLRCLMLTDAGAGEVSCEVLLAVKYSAATCLDTTSMHLHAAVPMSEKRLSTRCLVPTTVAQRMLPCAVVLKIQTCV